MSRFRVFALRKRQVLVLLFLVGLTVGILRGDARTAEAVALFESRVVVIDPGHGGRDPGAVGHGAVEKEVVLEISKYLKDFLEKSGARVILTRDSDRNLTEDGKGLNMRTDMEARVAIGNSQGADVFLSIHANAFPSPRWGGAQTFYDGTRHPLNESLALSIQKALVEHTGMTDRRVSQDIKHYVLKHVTVPAVTVEVGFLSHPREAALLQQPDYQRKVAWAIFMGLARFFREA